MQIKRVIDEIADASKPLVSTHLADLSQMTPADVPYLKSAWKNIPPERRCQVISRLVEIVRDNVEFNFDLIYKFCLHDPDEEVKTLAIEGLWENEDPLLIRAYSSMLENDPSKKVQAAAATALGRFAVMAECGKIRPEYGKSLSTTLLAVINNHDRPVEVRRRALEAAAPLSLPSVRETIRKAYESRDERFTVSAVYAMGKTCDTSWLPLIFKELDNPDAEIRYEAAGACGEIGAEECVPRLLEHINDHDIDVRLAVIESLGRIGGKEAKDGLLRNARDSNSAIREAISEALSEIEATEDMTLFEMKLPGQFDDQRN